MFISAGNDPMLGQAEDGRCGCHLGEAIEADGGRLDGAVHG